MLVVTGASGLLGAAVVSGAREQTRPVAAICHRNLLKFPNTTVQSVDLTDAKATRQLLASLRPTHIIHCAAATDVDWCEENPEPAKKINTDSSALLAELAVTMGARFLHVSTDAVFDGNGKNYAEADQTNPLNVYAETKLQAEHEVLRRDPSAAIARVNIYGWNAQNKLSLAEWVIARLAEGKSVPGFVNVFFTPMLVNDLAEFLLMVLDRGLSGLYHIGGSERISKYEFACRVAIAFGFDPAHVVPTPVEQVPLRAKRALDMSLNTDKISAALGRTMPDVDAGLRRFHDLRDTGYPQRLKGYLNGVRT